MRLKACALHMTIVMTVLAALFAATHHVITSRAANDTGSLEITLNVTVDGKATTGTFADGTYSFKVVRDADDTDVADPFITITNGRSSSVVIDDLEPGSYTVSENITGLSARAITLTTMNDIKSEIISNQTTNVSFTNDAAVGDLTVSCSVESDPGAPVPSLFPSDNTTVFTYEIEVANSNFVITGTYGDITFLNDRATISLRNGESAKAIGLPVGTGYYITQINKENYTIEYISGDYGVISSTPSEASFTSFREHGGLEINHTVVSAATEDVGRPFAFRITSLDEQLSGDFDGFNFVSGVAVVELSEHDSGRIINDLPAGARFKIEAIATEGFTFTFSSDTVTIPSWYTGSSNAVMDITTTRNTGSLTVTLDVQDQFLDVNARSFSFHVYERQLLDGTYSGLTFQNGEATFQLKNGQSKTISGLPVGHACEVTPDVPDGFDGGPGNYTELISATPAIIDIQCQRLTGTLWITNNVVSESTADKNRDFSYRVTLYDDENHTKIANLNMSAQVGGFGIYEFIDGVATFLAKSGDTINVDYLPAGVYYVVEETNADGFVTAKTGDTGMIPANGISEARFTNTANQLKLKLDVAWIADQDLTATVRFDLIRWVDGGAEGVIQTDTQTLYSSSTSWFANYDNLLKYDANLRDYRYKVNSTVLSIQKNGQTISIPLHSSANSRDLTDSEKTFGITFTQDLNIPVTITWSGGEENSSVEVQAFAKAPGASDYSAASDAVGHVARIALSKAGGWSGAFRDLPKYASAEDARNGREISYEVRQITTLPAYTSTITGDTAAGFTISNTFQRNEVWIPYVFYDGEQAMDPDELDYRCTLSGNMAGQIKNAVRNGTGKWVRYLNNGDMVKGWYTYTEGSVEKVCHYDDETGMKTTGWTVISGKRYYFDSASGELIQ